MKNLLIFSGIGWLRYDHTLSLQVLTFASSLSFSISFLSRILTEPRRPGSWIEDTLKYFSLSRNGKSKYSKQSARRIMTDVVMYGIDAFTNIDMISLIQKPFGSEGLVTASTSNRYRTSCSLTSCSVLFQIVSRIAGDTLVISSNQSVEIVTPSLHHRFPFGTNLWLLLGSRSHAQSHRVAMIAECPLQCVVPARSHEW